MTITCPTCGHKTKDDSAFYCGECQTYIGPDEAGDPHDIEALVKLIEPILAGKPPGVQGGVLADLLSMFLAGHPPQMREAVLQGIVACAKELIEPNEQRLFEHRPRPKEWDE